MLKKFIRILNFAFYSENSIVFQKNLKIIFSILFIILARGKHFGKTEHCLLSCSIVQNHLLFHLEKRFLAAALRNLG